MAGCGYANLGSTVRVVWVRRPEIWEIWERGRPKLKAGLRGYRHIPGTPSESGRKRRNLWGLGTPGVWGSGGSVELKLKLESKI